MKRTLLMLLASLSFHSYGYTQTWDWTHPEPNSDERLHDIKTDANGNVYVLASYLNGNTVTTDNGYLAKYDQHGTLLWKQIITADYANSANNPQINVSDLAVNSSGVYITGIYDRSEGYVDSYNCAPVISANKVYKIADYTFTSSIYDMGFFLAKFDFDGNLVWNKVATDSYTDTQSPYCTLTDRSYVNDFPVITSDLSNNLTVAFPYASGHNGFLFDGTAINTEIGTTQGGRELIALNLSQDGVVRWSNTAYTLSSYDLYGEVECNSIVADNNGNIFLSGQATNGAIFGSSTFQHTVQQNEAGVLPTYIAKLSSNGSWQYVKELATSNFGEIEYGHNNDFLTVDNNNNVYAVLTVQRSPYGANRYIMGELINPIYIDPYLVKMDNDGNLVWWKSFGTNTDVNSDNYGTGICFYNNSLFVTGAIRGGYFYSNYSNLTVASTTTSGLLQYMVAKADLNGEFQWVTNFSGGSNAGGFSVTAFNDNVYTSGYYRNYISTLGLLGANSTTSTSSGEGAFLGMLKDQYIKINQLAPTTVCPGSSLPINFTSLGLSFSSTNTFTAQLSDANGDFSNAVNIGSITSTGSGTINAIVPANLPVGTSGYKVRIVSSDLLNTGLPYYSYADINYSLTISSQTFYQDSDGDGFGNPAVSIQTCTPSAGYVTNNLDCDDGNASISPNTVWYLDADNDGYYTGSGVTSCTSPGTGYRYSGLIGGNDCDDNNVNIHSSVIYYRDADNDGFGDPNNSVNVCSLTPPSGYVTNSTDCDDTNANINPNAVWYLDADNDGYYTGAGVTSCSSPGTGYKYTGLTGSGDCNDSDPSVHPGATEICGNGIDDNCDGQIDEGCIITTPTLSISDATVYESQSVAVLTVSLSHPTTSDVLFSYATADGTATSLVQKGKKGTGTIPDYVSTKGNMTIPAGSSSATISIVVNNDNIVEPAETFTVSLSLNKANSKLATITKGTGTVTIIDGSPITVANNVVVKEQQLQTSYFSITSSPNPSSSSFMISLSGSDRTQRIVLRVIDVNGRVIDIKNNLMPGGTIRLGEKYIPGIYLIEAIQGTQRKTLKLIKE